MLVGDHPDLAELTAAFLKEEEFAGEWPVAPEPRLEPASAGPAELPPGCHYPIPGRSDRWGRWIASLSPHQTESRSTASAYLGYAPRSKQRNVYIAGHRLGWPGTESHLVFYHLDELARGDEILLKDRDGKSYRYRVSETFVVEPNDSWVMGKVKGRDMLTLQTCTPIPTWEKRLIVRADRI